MWMQFQSVQNKGPVLVNMDTVLWICRSSNGEGATITFSAPQQGGHVELQIAEAVEAIARRTGR